MYEMRFSSDYNPRWKYTGRIFDSSKIARWKLEFNFPLGEFLDNKGEWFWGIIMPDKSIAEIEPLPRMQIEG